MKLARRQLLQLAAAAAAVPILPRISDAQTYPTRPVRIVAGFPPGGVSDLYARLVSQWLSERLGQQFIVDNRTGAGGSIATEAVTRADPDGYTLLLTGANDAWNTALYDNLSFNYLREIAPVASVVRFPGVLVVQPSFAAETTPQLIAYAKANPGKINMASGGVGSAQHLFGELFKAMAGVDMVHVPYRGGGPALIDLLAGRVSLMFDTLPTAIDHIRAGKLRPLAVTAAARVEVLPDVSALNEFVPGYEASGWVGIGAPRNTPAGIIDKLNKEINAALVDPKMTARIADEASTPFTGSPAEFGKFMVEFTDKWAKVIRSAKIKLG